MLNLCDDVLKEILKFLELKELTKKRRVCKEWDGFILGIEPLLIIPKRLKSEKCKLLFGYLKKMISRKCRCCTKSEIEIWNMNLCSVCGKLACLKCFLNCNYKDCKSPICYSCNDLYVNECVECFSSYCKKHVDKEYKLCEHHKRLLAKNAPSMSYYIKKNPDKYFLIKKSDLF